MLVTNVNGNFTKKIEFDKINVRTNLLNFHKRFELQNKRSFLLMFNLKKHKKILAKLEQEIIKLEKEINEYKPEYIIEINDFIFATYQSEEFAKSEKERFLQAYKNNEKTFRFMEE